MKRIFFLIIAASLVLVACGTSKKTDYDKVDKSFEDFKDRNPDSD
jgi:major membrane immunogen (membrane-anchored lipoprotein)